MIASAHEKKRRVKMGRRGMLAARIRYDARSSSAKGRIDLELREWEEKAYRTGAFGGRGRIG